MAWGVLGKGRAAGGGEEGRGEEAGGRKRRARPRGGGTATYSRDRARGAARALPAGNRPRGAHPERALLAGLPHRLDGRRVHERGRDGAGDGKSHADGLVGRHGCCCCSCGGEVSAAGASSRREDAARAVDLCRRRLWARSWLLMVLKGSPVVLGVLWGGSGHCSALLFRRVGPAVPRLGV